MARLARLVVPGLPHLVTQHASPRAGGGRGRVFAGDDDYALYRDLLAEACAEAKVEVWAWCLLPGEARLILVPSNEDGLRRALAVAHRRYAGSLHKRRGKTGQFWRARFNSVVMDDAYLAAALRDLLQAPVKARLVRRPKDWRWSSARAHLDRRDDGLTKRSRLGKRFGSFRDVMAAAPDAAALARIEAALTVGRPVGDDAFMTQLERLTGRRLKPAKRGPKPRRRKRRVKGSSAGSRG